MNILCFFGLLDMPHFKCGAVWIKYQAEVLRIPLFNFSGASDLKKTPPMPIILEVLILQDLESSSYNYFDKEQFLNKYKLSGPLLKSKSSTDRLGINPCLSANTCV